MADEILEMLKSAQALVRQGWCQHTAEITKPDGHKSYCPIGALLAVSDQSFFYTADLLCKVINSIRTSSSIHSITTWNDHPDRTQADVLAAFDRALAMVDTRLVEYPSEL